MTLCLLARASLLSETQFYDSEVPFQTGLVMFLFTFEA